MSRPPRISVVIIFLDGARFLAEAIESVFAQTCGDWELLLVDDGSTDDSPAIARRYAELQPDRVRLLAHPGGVNRGMSASRNLGARHARGEMLAFLDADDVYLPEKLERQSALLDAWPAAAMVYGATLHWHGWTGREEDRARDRLRTLGVPPDTFVQPPELVRRYLAHAAWPPGTCGILVRRAAFERAGGFEERFRGMFEDQAFFYKLALAEPIFVESGSWDLYRQHPGSWCETAIRRGEYAPGRVASPARCAFFEWLAVHVKSAGVGDPEIRRLLAHELWTCRHPVLHRLASLPYRPAEIKRMLAKRGLLPGV